MVESSLDLEGNIQLDEFDQEESKTGAAGMTSGFRQEGARPDGNASSQNGNANGETFNTLDEPVSETIVSKLLKRWLKKVFLRGFLQTNYD